MEIQSITGNNGLLKEIIKDNCFNNYLDEIVNTKLKRKNFQNEYFYVKKTAHEGMNFGTTIHEIIEYKLKHKDNINIFNDRKILPEILNNKNGLNDRLTEFTNKIKDSCSEECINLNICNREIRAKIDIITKDSIYDIKCYKEFTKHNKKEFILQLIIYYILIYKINPKTKINNLCIYDFYRGDIYTFEFNGKELLKDLRELSMENNILFNLLKQPRKKHCVIL